MTGHQLVEEDGADPQRPPEVEAACGHMVAVVSNSKAGSMDVVNHLPREPEADNRDEPAKPDPDPRAPVREVRCDEVPVVPGPRQPHVGHDVCRDHAGDQRKSKQGVDDVDRSQFAL